MKHFEHLNVPSGEPSTASRSFDGPSNLAYLLSIARRRKYFLLAGLIAGLVGGSIYFLTVKPKYTATASIYIDNPGKTAPEKGADASAATVDTAEIDSQVEVIRSSQVVETMVKTLAPEFRGALAREFASHRPPAPAAGTAAPTGDRTDSDLDLGGILKALSVSRVDKTYVLGINFTAKSPTLAAAVVNSFVAAYQKVLDDRYVDGEKFRAKWIDQRLREVRDALLQADRDLQAFRLSPVVGESDAAKRELELETESYRKLYQSLLQQRQAPSQSFPEDVFHVITPGDPSAARRGPKLSLVAMLSIVAGLGAGAVGAGLLEMGDRTFRTRGQVETSLGARFLGWLPIIRTKPRRRLFGGAKAEGDAQSHAPVLRFSTDEPQSCYAGTLREIRACLSLLPPKNESKVVGIVSALPNEGKSILSLNLGRLLASEGTRSLVIDGDFRKRRLSKILAPSTERGLYHLLGENHARPQLQDLFIQERTSGMVFLPVADLEEGAGRPGAKLAQKFGATLTEARSLFDVVVVDLPPLAAAADTRSLTASCDCFVLVTEWGRTHRGAVWKFLESEPEIRERLLGVVLNKVDLRRLKQYEQSHEPQYHAYREYFSDSGRYRRST